MPFIEMTGKTLAGLVTSDEIHKKDLREAGVDDESLVRVNRQGDIEVRRRSGWDIIGGLLGEFEDRVREAAGRDWA